MKKTDRIPLVPVQANHDETEASRILGTNGGPSVHSPFMEELHRRANQPWRGSPEYLRAIAKCEEAHEWRRRSDTITLSRMEWNPRLVALLVFLLIALGAIFWAGCRGADAFKAVVGHHADAISKALND